MVILLDISSFTKIIENEIKLLEKKTDEEINIEKMNENKKLLYDYFEKYYNNNIFVSNVKSILHNHNLRLNSLIFINEIDYIKHFGYNKIKRIGSGSFGITYLCHKNNKKYAIKLQKYNNEYGNLEKFINNNFREYNNLKKLNKSPCRAFVPKVYDIIFIFDESKPILYSLIIMEFINGITLHEYIDKKGELTITDKKKLDDNIDKLHKFGIFHRDLNSENIMVVKKENNNNFIFIDYGLSATKKNMKNNSNKLNKIYNNNNKVKNDITINKKLYISINNIIDNKLIVISSFINLIDKETKLLEKKN
jgi:serine/threonine protein kinase